MKIITTLLRSEQDKVYDQEYVDNLLWQIWQHTDQPFSFVCYTNDLGLLEMYNPIPYSSEDYWRWWGKVDIFRSVGPCLYFDLDTVILGDLDPLIKAVEQLSEESFMMLRAFNPHREWASGIMAWNGDFRFVCDNWTYEQSHVLQTDQRYIMQEIEKAGKKVQPINDHANVISFKRHILTCQKGDMECVDSNVDIVCFHGKPRLADIKGEVEWLAQIW